MTETKGYFGQFGGSFVPEPIQNLLNQLEETFEQYKNDPEFIAEYKHYLNMIVANIPKEYQRFYFDLSV